MKRILLSWLLVVLMIAMVIGTVGIYAHWTITNVQISSAKVPEAHAPGYGQQAWERTNARYEALCEYRSEQFYHSACPYHRLLTAERPVWADMLVFIGLNALYIVTALFGIRLARKCANDFIIRTVKDCEKNVLDFENRNVVHAHQRNVLCAELIIAIRVAVIRKHIRAIDVQLQQQLPRKERLEASEALERAQKGLQSLLHKQAVLRGAHA